MRHRPCFCARGNESTGRLDRGRTDALDELRHGGIAHGDTRAVELADELITGRGTQIHRWPGTEGSGGLRAAIVEHLEERQTQVSLGDQVDAAADVIRAVVGDSPLRRFVQQVDQLLLDGGHDTASGHSPVHHARHREDRVAQLLGVEPAADTIPHARKAANEALKLDERDGQAHMTLGYVALFFDWDWDTARRELELALELDPTNVLVQHAYADYLGVMGDIEASLRRVLEGRRLDPLGFWANQVVRSSRVRESHAVRIQKTRATTI